ncbi:cbb3-type cytochrome oxidase assembly protein CcoS [Ignatzschineria cameli]|uniref:Cbb3-type cytochrome oxidase assembly protein CcoS n=1 Tax=Ignatzschineria cameli TaxID=2182793 RepID=A0A2U2ASW6_9GAMM|nr:cbb3-type cytochrome oxidase assembly protein CcoS [Ignatzschineria cameli]PWD85962.1 cbb3-type cytochrome oxidase assembly protein CcoS [Ignatzschineria cameli]PWD87828.1 cbb3-type cytochrome oxidase assembly protein CcoS [Ignatzschineria cameli]PWD90397.1 cbb3-type cytochrome oxidase assembly protein CcoS [Ignatzschineria cameli]PWD92280.1 cbb3-type cytochrome oxidase assembly protein CcoS [Ignatzschineria cameli]PWD93074.1 cbb3-type cytochrome oxidase assembly protein CcoS [Ignatzschiner
MSPLFILLPLTLVGMVVAGYAFIWAVRSDQFDDMEGPAYKILFDEDVRPLDEEEKKAEDHSDEPSKSDEDGSVKKGSKDEGSLTAKERLEDENR